MHNLDQELVNILSDELQKEIDNDIIHNIIMLSMPEWIMIKGIAQTELTTAWIENNSLYEVCKFTGRVWLFKNEKDAELFVLTFS